MKNEHFSSVVAVTERVDLEHMLVELICRLKIPLVAKGAYTFIRVPQSLLIPIKMKVQ